MTDFPEGTDLDDIRETAIVANGLISLINLQAAYLAAPEGSAEETKAEEALLDLVGALEQNGVAAARVAALACQVLIATADEKTVQLYMDGMADDLRKAKEALGG